MVNPLIDEIFDLLLQQQKWKVHTLADSLRNYSDFNNLDADPQKNIFKRNFLLMNALFQLQQQVLPTKQLLISSLHIELLHQHSNSSVSPHQPLRDYYLDWQNYDTEREEIDTLLQRFWQQFSRYAKTSRVLESGQLKELTTAWQLPQDYSIKELQKRWRQQALLHHPDKQGCTSKFKTLQQQYEQLKAHYYACQQQP